MSEVRGNNNIQHIERPQPALPLRTGLQSAVGPHSPRLIVINNSGVVRSNNTLRMFLSLLTLAMASLSSCQDSPAPAPILFLINSQPGGYHSTLADKSRQSILSQWKGFVPASLMKSPQVLLTSQMDPEVGLS